MARAEDKQQIGLTTIGDEALRSLADAYFDGSGVDAYRFCIAYAIGVGLDVKDAPQSGYTTKYNALGGVESGTYLRDLLEILDVGDASRPFATAERLAELGVREVTGRLQNGEGLADILDSATEGDARHRESAE